MPSSSDKPLFAAGNEAEWARINAEEERQEAEFAASLSIPERLELGQKLCDRAFDFYNAVHANNHGQIIDGFAVIAHGYFRATKDSDLLVPDGPEAR